MSQNIKDKIVNHLVAGIILRDFFDKTLIDTTIATRKGKGMYKGLKMTKEYLNKMRYKYNDNFYYLKFDIKKFFYNIDHEIVMNLIKRKIEDKYVLKILEDVINSTDEEYINKEISKLKK